MQQTLSGPDQDTVPPTLAGIIESERARQIASAIQQSLQDLASAMDAGKASGTAVADAQARCYAITRTGGCIACEPGACPLCGHLFTGEIIHIAHEIRGRRNLSDKAVHYLSHGLNRYETGYIIRGEPVTVELDLEELAAYLDL